ncbi:MAG: sel1 repeat family protein [Thermoguttaceae bacterium]|nr:sel1 repeat family protein [Thermoguttaceae bacterium]
MANHTRKWRRIPLVFLFLLGPALLAGCKKEPAPAAANSHSSEPAEVAQTAEKSFRETFAGGRLAGIVNLEEVYKSAEEGDSMSQLALGESLLNTGKDQSEKAEGVEWIRKAAEDEYNSPAHYSLGMCYAEGNGVEQDDAEAFKWFKKGADEGHYVSQYQLALCQIEGRGTEQNRDAGIELLQALAANDWGEEAQEKLAELGVEPAEISLQERIIRTTPPEVEQIYKRAEAGDESAQLSWGQTLLMNAKTESEKAEGVEWIRKAAEQEGCSAAPCVLGICYLEGNGVEQDEAEAFRWFQKGAASCGRSDVRYQLALCYIEGKGTEQNRDAGIEILRELAKKGFDDAQAKLKELGEE